MDCGQDVVVTQLSGFEWSARVGTKDNGANAFRPTIDAIRWRIPEFSEMMIQVEPMSHDDHHDHPFDQGTRTKLFIYQSYLQAWLQVFIHTSRFPGRPLQFFDFFSGPGQDPKGNPGSPLILMEELERNRDMIFAKRRTISVFFNDYDRAKTEALRALCQSRHFSWQPEIQSRDFEDA